MWCMHIIDWMRGYFLSLNTIDILYLLHSYTCENESSIKYQLHPKQKKKILDAFEQKNMHMPHPSIQSRTLEDKNAKGVKQVNSLMFQ